MRRVICGEKWLLLNMVTQDSVGFPLHLTTRIGLAVGDMYPKVGRDSFHTSPLRYVMVLPSFFGHNHWCGEVPLKELFLSLYVLAVDRNAPIANYQEHLSSGYVWAHIFAQDRFIDDDTLIIFFNKPNEPNLGDSSLDNVNF